MNPARGCTPETRDENITVFFAVVIYEEVEEPVVVTSPR